MAPVKGTRQHEGSCRGPAPCPPGTTFSAPCWHAPPATADIVLSAYQEVVHASEQAAMRSAPSPSASTCRAACSRHGWQLLAPRAERQRGPGSGRAQAAAKDTATTSSVPASSLAGTATQPPADPGSASSARTQLSGPAPAAPHESNRQGRAKADRSGQERICRKQNTASVT
jgi:hypothetical protein